MCPTIILHCCHINKVPSQIKHSDNILIQTIHFNFLGHDDGEATANNNDEGQDIR